MSATGGLLSVVTSIATLVDAQEAIENLDSNQRKLDSKCVGVNNSFFQKVEITADSELSINSGKIQIVNVVSSIAGITVTIPDQALLVVGCAFLIHDHSWNANTYNITIDRGDSTIDNVAGNLTVDKAGGKVWLLYIDTGKFITLVKDIT